MTPMGQIIIGLVLVLAYCIGRNMQKSLSDITIESQKSRLKFLEERLEWYDKWTDTLFNEQDMRDSYYQGRNDEYDVLNAPDGVYCPKVHPSDTFKEWLKSKYKEPEHEEVIQETQTDKAS